MELRRRKKINKRDKEILKKNQEEDFELGATDGGKEIYERLKQETQIDLDLYGGDIDAGWKNDLETEEESVGGTIITPDKDEIDEIGKGVGLTYRQDEEIDSDKKIKWKEAQGWKRAEEEE